ncbi:unnamed protein product [Cylicocyclus nassatus]|uniref:RGS domain-containing protein n=1 Tax=Cylicocyclus nassatus TaxID=53992 RepID=A0AA36GTI7_CYLNA|nr:unnamed protein product [Cylicocyclus nassatus]
MQLLEIGHFDFVTLLLEIAGSSFHFAEKHVNGVNPALVAGVSLEEDDVRDSMRSTDDPISVHKSFVLAYDIDSLMEDPSGLAFFIQFLESCDKLNLIKFWIHVNGYKSSFEEGLSGTSQKVELSLVLLDARNIYDRYIDKESATSLSFPKSICERISARLSEDGLGPDLFDEAKESIRNVFVSRYLKDFMNSIYYKKYLLQVLSRGCSLDDILLVPALLNAFLEFVDNDHDRNCIQFLLACNTFEASYDTLSDKELLEDAMCIYDKYFSMQAVSSLQVNDHVRQVMESEICTDSGRPLRSSFLSAKQSCMQRLVKKYLRAFVRSPGYLNYLIELEAEVCNAIELPRPNREKNCAAGSSSSDSLLMNFGKTFESPVCKPASVKSAQYSPLLGRHDKSFNIAEVDCMGQYHVLYDDSLTQDFSTPAKIRQKLRKYLDKSAVKEEEVALEVARTIIADVHNMVEAGKR